MKKALCVAWFVLCSIYIMNGVCAERTDNVLPPEKAIIKVVDSLKIDLSKMDSTICIDGKVVLSFDHDSIFACEWIDLETGDTISKAKSVTVSPKTTHEYQVNLYYFTGELIKNGDFEDESKPENRRVTTDYKFGDDYTNFYGVLGPEGTYRIGKSPHDFHSNFYDIPDHTNGHGNMMVVNGSTSGNAVVWKQTIKVEKGRTYAFSTWGIEVGRNHPAQFHFTINGKTLGKDFQLIDYGREKAKWDQFYELWVADKTTAVISLVNLNIEPDGNDFAIDDISFASMKKLTGKITVKVLPAVELGKLEDIEHCEGEKVVVNARAAGTGITAYKWMKDGVLLPNKGTALEYINVSLQDSGRYTCSVSGECGTIKEAFDLAVRPLPKVEKLYDTVRPCDETNVMFNAGLITGYTPVYNWTGPLKSKGWSGQKTANYYKNPIHWELDAGEYICHISTRCGDMDVHRVLEAGTKIKITDWPGDMSVCEGEDVKLFVKTEPEAELISWVPTTPIFHGQELVLKQVGMSDQRTYYCMVWDKCNFSEVASLILKVLPALSRLEVSPDTAVCEGGRAVFKAVADGLKTKYSWEGPGGFKSDEAEIIIDPVSPDCIGTYQVTAIDSCGNEMHDSVRLSFLNEYGDLQITGDLEACPGERVRLEVNGGKIGMVYDWILPGNTHVPGAVLQTEAVAGEYICRVGGVCLPVEKSTTISLKEKLHAYADQNDFLVCPEETIQMKAFATGTDVTFNWWKNEVYLGEGAILDLSQVQAAQAGIYECRIHSACGDTVLYYELQLKEPLAIISHTSEKFVSEGEKVSLFVNVSGDSERNYEWFLDGVVIPGENGNRLEVQVPGRDTVVTYTCKVSGCNTVRVVIPVTVRDYITLTKDTSLFLCRGDVFSYRGEEMMCDADSQVKSYWIHNGKDTVSRVNAITFPEFLSEMRGEYVYHSESACGEKILRLQVDTIPTPKIREIHISTGVEEEGVFIVCAGNDVLLEAEVQSQGVVTYEWKKEGKVIPGAIEPVLNLKNVATDNEGKYSCRVISAECGEDEKEVALKVYKKLTVAYIPSVEKCPGEKALLKVNTEASVPSTFVWSGPDKHGWTAESDGFTGSYNNASLATESEGIYKCNISNICGQETASIQVIVEKEIVLPEILRQDTLCEGESVKLQLPLDQAGVKYVWTLPNHAVLEQEILTIDHFALADTGVYHYHVNTKNSCFSIDGDIKLSMRPALQAPLVSPDTAVCEGQSAHFSAFVAGKDVEYEWWGPQGMHVKGQSVDVTSVTADLTGTYEVVVTDICNKTGKRGKVNLKLLKEFEDLSITQDTVVCKGSDVVLRIGGKTEGLQYEWRLGEKVLGHGDTLLLSGVMVGDSGKYICQVSGTCQAVTREAKVGLYPDLRAEKEEFLPVCERENAVLAVKATGEQLKYKWMKEGLEKGDRTGHLELNDVIPANGGIYECHVSSLCGDTTLKFEFQLKEKTRVVFHSADRILCEGDNYKLMVSAEGENNKYLWTCDGVVLPEQDSMINRTAPMHADTLLYTCLVQGECGVDSASMTILVGEFRKIRVKDFRDTLCEGSNYKYNIDVIPSGAFEGQGFNYRWTFKGKELYSGTSSIFPLPYLRPEQEGLQPDQAGDYLCEITTLPGAPVFCRAEVSVHIEVIRLPKIESITSDIYAIEGSHDSIKVVASGDQLSYSWVKDGITISETSSTLHFIPVVYEDRGTYRVTVSNRCSHVTRATELEVWKKTVIVYPQERDDSVCMYGDRQLDVLAWGETGLQYNWYLNGVLLDAPLTQPFNIERATPEDEGLYLCVVTGRGGADSCRIHLKVLSLPEVNMDGKFYLCKDDASVLQEYLGSSNEKRVSYQWEIESGDIMQGADWEQTIVRWNKQDSGVLTLKVTSLSSGCRDSLSREIKYHAVPEIDLTVPEYVGDCQDTLKLNRAYPWGGMFTVNGAPTDVVRFSDKDIFYAIEYFYADEETGCSSIGYDTIRIASAPEIKLAEDTIVSGWCAPVNIEVKEHSAGDIIWEGKPFPEVKDELHASYQANAYSDEALKFWAILTDQYQCRASDTSVVVLLPSPEVVLKADSVIGICNDLVLTGEYDLKEDYKIEWSSAGKLKIDGCTAEVLDKKEGLNQFKLFVTDRYGCVGRDTAEVIVKGAPILESREICAGDSLSVDMTGYTEFIWDDGYIGGNRILKEPGVYRVEVKDSFGCKGEAVYDIHSLPIVQLEDTLIYDGQKMVYEVEEKTDYPPYEVLWQDGTKGYSYVAEKEGYYSIRIQDNIGCTVRDTAFLTVKKWYIAAPDAFLPATQGENARFYLKEVNFGSHFEMYIYDRWGELLFKTNEIGFKGGWDGTFKGIHCQPGAYVWVAFVDGKEVGRGTLMLVK